MFYWITIPSQLKQLHKEGDVATVELWGAVGWTGTPFCVNYGMYNLGDVDSLNTALLELYEYAADNGMRVGGLYAG